MSSRKAPIDLLAQALEEYRRQFRVRPDFQSAWSSLADRFLLTHDPDVARLILMSDFDVSLPAEWRGQRTLDLRATRGKPLPAKFAAVVALIKEAGLRPGDWDWIAGDEVRGVRVERVMNPRPDGREPGHPRVFNLLQLTEYLFHKKFQRGMVPGGDLLEVTEVRLAKQPPIRDPDPSLPLSERQLRILSSKSRVLGYRSVEEVRRMAAQFRAKLPNILGIHWGPRRRRPRLGASYSIRIVARWEGKVVSKKRRTGLSCDDKPTEAVQGLGTSADSGRSQLDLPAVGGFVEMVRNLLGVDLRYPSDPKAVRTWKRQLLERLRDAGGRLEELNRRVRMIPVTAGMSLDDVRDRWREVEADRDTVGLARKSVEEPRRQQLRRHAEAYGRLRSWTRVAEEADAQWGYEGFCRGCKRWIPLRTKEVDDDNRVTPLRCTTCNTDFAKMRPVEYTARNIKEAVSRARKRGEIA